MLVFLFQPFAFLLLFWVTLSRFFLSQGLCPCDSNPRNIATPCPTSHFNCSCCSNSLFEYLSPLLDCVFQEDRYYTCFSCHGFSAWEYNECSVSLCLMITHTVVVVILACIFLVYLPRSSPNLFFLDGWTVVLSS